MPENPERERPPDIEVGATVRMKKVRFEEVSDVEAKGHGEPGYESRPEGERESLPDEVEEGKTYRDAAVHRHLSIRLKESNR